MSASYGSAQTIPHYSNELHGGNIATNVSEFCPLCFNDTIISAGTKVYFHSTTV